MLLCSAYCLGQDTSAGILSQKLPLIYQKTDIMVTSGLFLGGSNWDSFKVL